LVFRRKKDAKVPMEEIAKYMEMIEKLKAKNAELERFAYAVSHDLKSSIITIQGFVGMLRKDLERNEAEKVESDLKFTNKMRIAMSANYSIRGKMK